MRKTAEATGRISKAAIKKISDASAKKARKAIAKAGLSDIKLPTAAGEPGKFRESVNSAVSKKINSFSEKQLGMLSKNNYRSFVKSKSKKKSTECFRAF
jgi:hypothetical protein